MTRRTSLASPFVMERARNEMELLEDPGNLIDELCEHEAYGQGLVAWCDEMNVRASTVRAWIEANSERREAFRIAERMRADRAAMAVEALSRRLLDPGAVTGHPWVDVAIERIVDGERPALDSKAARVAMAGLQWTAQVRDGRKYGKQVNHDHVHRVQDEHLAALKMLVRGKPAATIEGEVVVLDRKPGLPETHPFALPAIDPDMPRRVPLVLEPLPVDPESGCRPFRRSDWRLPAPRPKRIRDS